MTSSRVTAIITMQSQYTILWKTIFFLIFSLIHIIFYYDRRGQVMQRMGQVLQGQASHGFSEPRVGEWAGLWLSKWAVGGWLGQRGGR